MTGATAHWLVGQRALVAGSGEAVAIVADALAAAGATVEHVETPPVDAAEIAATFAAIEAKQGGAIDLLVHAGATLPVAPAETIGLDVWRQSFSADIDGRFLYAAEFARRAIAAGTPGNILFLMPSPAATAGRAASATANGALDNLVKSLAVEWGRDGIRVNAIASRACEARSDAVRASLGHLAAYVQSGYGAYITGVVMGLDEI